MALKKRSDGRYKATYTHKGKKHYFYGATRDEANAKREAYIDALKKAPNMDGSITEYRNGWTNILSTPKRAYPKQPMAAMKALSVYT